jgi:hypothetical protein
MKRLWILAGALAVTLATLTLAMLLGGTAFRYRTQAQHEARLWRVMDKQPTVESLTQGLLEEKATLIAAPATREEAERVITAHGGIKSQDIRGKASRYALMRVFRAGDMFYFIFFDAAAVMRDFACVSG